MLIYNYKIVKEKTDIFYDGRRNINSPEVAAEIFKNYYMSNFDLDKEHFSIILLDTSNKILGINLVSMGTLNESLVHPREVFRPAILAAANSVMLCHNHPSGSLNPSANDIGVSKRLRDAGELIGIKVLDHIILGDNDFVSMKRDEYF